MNIFNTLKKALTFSLFFILTSVSFASTPSPVLTSKNQVYNELTVNNSSLLMPTSPLGTAILIFMLIIALAFGITRLKSNDLSIN
ncbi:MAG: hypothetical protein NVSMB45_15810 [Ginsengibacter sp.]